ncbi:GtrA family protein [Nakamurella sp. YIM 132087]|uniref:GtrA family protein n=1 Tax=Nakamurella alba TaxID=2665158 RepID=A0A7K1FL57_9ACTN|nr:GtrA family protein [Nakamurella alba]MTD14109.1 GtrA family protein [Nakamurella alba]
MAEPERGPLLLLLDQRVAFVLVGAFNTAFSFAVFTALDLWWHTWVQLELLIAQQSSLVTAFVLHRRFVFRVRGHVARDFLRFELVQITSLLLNLALITVLVDLAGLPALPSQAGVTVLLVLLSFFGHRDFSFRRTDQEKAAQHNAAQPEGAEDTHRAAVPGAQHHEDSPSLPTTAEMPTTLGDPQRLPGERP